MREARHTRPHGIWLNLYCISRKGKELLEVESSCCFECLLGAKIERGVSKRSSRAAGDDGKCPQMNCGGDCTLLYIYQEPLDCTPNLCTLHSQWVNFMVYKLHLNVTINIFFEHWSFKKLYLFEIRTTKEEGKKNTQRERERERVRRMSGARSWGEESSICQLPFQIPTTAAPAPALPSGIQVSHVVCLFTALQFLLPKTQIFSRVMYSIVWVFHFFILCDLGEIFTVYFLCNQNPYSVD